ncbi:MAG: HD domain-containing protein [archaeon]|jgi:HD superfamily phosphodiesterase
MKLEKQLEDQIKEIALEELEKGKPDFNIPHTILAVEYMRKLISNEGGDERILITAIYLHDIGYAGLIKNGTGLADRIDAKKLHMIKGSKKSKELLKPLGFTKKEIQEISNLILTHDTFENNKTHNEQLMFEADSLAMINRDRAPGTFSEEDMKAFLKFFKRLRIPLIKTKTGKQIFEELWTKL